MITIGITDCSKWKNYHDWLASAKVKVIKLSTAENNINDIDRCDGIVLSGGEDVHPKYYGHPEWMDKKDELKLDVNEARDEFEMKVIDRAYKKKMPMLGICRGLQIANVYFKGTLIPDISKKPFNPDVTSLSRFPSKVPSSKLREFPKAISNISPMRTCSAATRQEAMAAGFMERRPARERPESPKARLPDKREVPLE